MKKSLIRGLFLLSCLFFFSNLEVNAQTFKPASELKSDLAIAKTSLNTDYHSTAQSDIADLKLIKQKYRALDLITDDLTPGSDVEKLLIAALVKSSAGTITSQNYFDKDFPNSEIAELYTYLNNLLTE